MQSHEMMGRTLSGPQLMIPGQNYSPLLSLSQCKKALGDWSPNEEAFIICCSGEHEVTHGGWDICCCRVYIWPVSELISICGLHDYRPLSVERCNVKHCELSSSLLSLEVSVLQKQPNSESYPICLLTMVFRKAPQINMVKKKKKKMN